MPPLLYTLVIVALLPWAILHLLWRARRQPDYLKHWGERFGLFPPRPPGKLIWIHAVSVGETRAAQPLIAALNARFPEHRILLTHMTPTGRATSEALFGDKVARTYLPYDLPWAVQRFQHHYQPEIGIIMETELWPNLIAASRQRKLPMLLVNARLSDKSARRYARFPALTRTTLEQLSAIACISPDDSRRLLELGAPEAHVFGNMKFDIAPPPVQLELGMAFRTRFGDRPVFLCASTREGEEVLILDAWKKIAADNNPLLVIVPRHPQRFEEVARLIEARNLIMQRRSDGQAVAAATQVWLGDSMGEMFAYYAAADLAFVGGSLLDFGSQNLIEACAVGTPVLIGPSTFNFTETAQGALATGAARQIADADELASVAHELLTDADQRTRMGDAGRTFATRHRGATERTLHLIEKYIPMV